MRDTSASLDVRQTLGSILGWGPARIGTLWPMSGQLSAGRPALCIWCGQRIDPADDSGASFFFLAKDSAGKFVSAPDHWLDQSPHLEGHQFFCHVRCFRGSVPKAQQQWLERAVDAP